MLGDGGVEGACRLIRRVETHNDCCVSGWLPSGLWKDLKPEFRAEFTHNLSAEPPAASYRP